MSLPPDTQPPVPTVQWGFILQNQTTVNLYFPPEKWYDYYEVSDAHFSYRVTRHYFTAKYHCHSKSGFVLSFIRTRNDAIITIIVWDLLCVVQRCSSAVVERTTLLSCKAREVCCWSHTWQPISKLAQCNWGEQCDRLRSYLVAYDGKQRRRNALHWCRRKQWNPNTHTRRHCNTNERVSTDNSRQVLRKWRNKSHLVRWMTGLILFYSRKTNFTLVVALDGEDKAGGDLYWDDGESIGKACNT